MTELLTMMATPLWAYLALFGFLAVDAMIPVVPIQAIMITSGALTVYGNLDLPLVILIGAAGMFTGDAIAFLLGRSTGHVGQGWLSGRIGAFRARCAPKHDDEPREPSRTRQAAARFTRGLRRPGPLVMLLCRFVPGGRMAAGFHAGRVGYPVKLFVIWDGLAALCWAGYGGLVGHIGGTAITQSAWRLFAIAATAAIVFGTAGWILALFGGGKDDATGEATAVPTDPAQTGPVAAGPRVTGGKAAGPRVTGGKAAGLKDTGLAAGIALAAAAGAADLTAARAASADEPLRRSTRTATGR